MSVRSVFGWFLRYGIGLGFCGSGLFVLVEGAGKAGGYAEGLGVSLMGISLVLTGSILLGYRLAPWAAAPLLRWIDSIYLPGGSVTPPVTYRLAHYYRSQRRYDECLAEYARIIQLHPQEGAAYLEGFDVAVEAGEPAVAKRIYRRGWWHLRSGEARDSLNRRYENLIGRRRQVPVLL